MVRDLGTIVSKIKERINSLDDWIYMQECYLQAVDHNETDKAIIKTNISDMQQEIEFLKVLINE